ncbi:VC0807 family protein [Amycolatopsis sp. NPDC048633]|uniref:VC0807 family protein n=1 Tax=Amycolatopsis sp. NPDC048633 TaxID=3157095 RepID=UPI0033D23E64
MIALLLWDAGLPLAAYYGLRLAGQSEQVSLLAGALFAAARLVFVAVKRRSFDGFAALLAAVLAIGLALSLVTGDIRFILVKESFGTGAAAIVVLASCFTRAPLILTAVRAGSGEAKRARIDRLCAEAPGFAASFRLMSAVWGIGLLAEALARVPLVYLVSPDIMAALSTVLLLATIGALSLWTAWYANRRQALTGPESAAAARSAGP